VVQVFGHLWDNVGRYRYGAPAGVGLGCGLHLTQSHGSRS
jgi:hypothetical protein